MRFTCVSSHQLDKIEQREGRFLAGRPLALATSEICSIYYCYQSNGS